jgi:hypothetical protein
MPSPDIVRAQLEHVGLVSTDDLITSASADGDWPKSMNRVIEY